MNTQNAVMGSLKGERQQAALADHRFDYDQQGEVTIPAEEIDALPVELQTALLLWDRTRWKLNYAAWARLRRHVGHRIDEVRGGLADLSLALPDPLIEASEAHRAYVQRQADLAVAPRYYLRGFAAGADEQKLRGRLASEVTVLALHLPAKTNGTPYATVILEKASAEALMERLQKVHLLFEGKALRFSPAPARLPQIAR